MILKLICESDWVNENTDNCNLSNYNLIQSDNFFIFFCEEVVCGCYQSGCPIFLIKKSGEKYNIVDECDWCFVDDISNINNNRMIFECRTYISLPDYSIIGSQLIVLNRKLEKFEIIKNSSMSRSIDKVGFLHPDSIN